MKLLKNAPIAALVLVMLAILPAAGPAAAQAGGRWLADPALLAAPKFMGPPADRTTFDTIADIALSGAGAGWATAGSGVMRLENGLWRRFQPVADNQYLSAIGLDGQEGGWIVGREVDRAAPNTSRALMLSYLNGGWRNGSNVARGDGTTAPVEGALADVAVFPGNQVWAVGSAPSDIPNWSRPLVLYHDGLQWRDVTPPEWRYGYLSSLSMVGPTEGWAAGLLGQPGGQGADAVRPALLHLRDNTWTEAPLPALPSRGQPFTVYGVTMRDAGEGWAIYFDSGAECGFGTLLHYAGGAWSAVPPASVGWRSITAIGLIPGTNTGWVSLGGCGARGQNLPAQRAHFDGGSVTVDAGGSPLVPSVYALLDASTQYAAADGYLMRYTGEPPPTERVAGARPGERFFPETGHTIAGDFRRYYETHGLELGDRGVSPRESLALFGYPVSQPFVEANPENGERYTVQYFERARFELHPENAEPYRVLLGRLGALSLARRRPGAEPIIPNPDPSPPPAGCARFAETGYATCAPFTGFWRRHGGLAVFGLPIAGARDEQSETDGRIYQTQWFERERMEYHPENKAPYDVLLGLLGSEELRLRGY